MKHNYLPDVLTFLTHSVTALVVTLGHKVIEDLPIVVQLILFIVYLSAIVFLYKRLRATLAKEEQRETSKLQRYSFLRKKTLQVVGEFIKERYWVNYNLTTKINELVDSGRMSVSSLKSLLDEADKVRVEKVKETLRGVSSCLEEDDFKRPLDADGDNKDEMKVSFYAVEPDPENPNEEVLIPKARAYPNESTPKTPRFRKGEGVSGKAWMEKIVIICENGGEDPQFTEMRPGQKEEYASMICVPAIMDVPAYHVNEVYGIVTLDSPIRKGYFQKGLEKFWADLVQPICNILIYARESSTLITSLKRALESIPDTTGAHNPEAVK